jgi:general secretion pathway protein B
MSYILDALRRAEAERERGAVPGLQSQQHSLEGEDDAPERSRLLVWAVIGLAFALIATLAWTLLGGSSSAPRQIAETTATATATAPATVTPAAPVAQSLSEIAAQPSASLVPPPTPSTAPATLPTTTTPPPVRVVQTPKATPLAMPAATPPARPAAPTPTPTPTPKAAPAVALDAPKPAATAASEPHVYAQAELPEEIRRELPRVAVNGSSYSGDAASRMVMINGQVFHEGDQLAAGLVLDKIKRRSAVLAYKGWRYEITF